MKDSLVIKLVSGLTHETNVQVASLYPIPYTLFPIPYSPRRKVKKMTRDEY